MNELAIAAAPVAGAALNELRETAAEVLRTQLAGRKICDFRGPLGWQASAVPLGRVRELSHSEGVRVSSRLSLPLVELRADFRCSRAELEAASRGARDLDTGPVERAARALAAAEEALVFEGEGRIGMAGLLTAADHEPLALDGTSARYPVAVMEGLERLRAAAVKGPYALVAGSRLYADLQASSSEGFPVARHVSELLAGGPILWAPQLRNGALLSLRGGDFELIVGRDAALGYTRHDAETVELYLEESLAFRLLGPEAVVPLRYPNGDA